MVIICTSRSNYQYSAFFIDGFCMTLKVKAIISLNINKLMFVMVPSCVLFEVRPEFLNTV
jgi:hypothetical protein